MIREGLLTLEPYSVVALFHAGRSSGSGVAEMCPFPVLPSGYGTLLTFTAAGPRGLFTPLPCPACTIYSVIVPQGTPHIVRDPSVDVNPYHKYLRKWGKPFVYSPLPCYYLDIHIENNPRGNYGRARTRVRM